LFPPSAITEPLLLRPPPPPQALIADVLPTVIRGILGEFVFSDANRAR